MEGNLLDQNKKDAVASLKLFTNAVVIPSGSCTQRIRTDKGKEYTSKKFENYRLQTQILYEYASTATLPQVGGRRWQGWCDSSSRTPVYRIFCGKNSYEAYTWERRRVGYSSNSTSFRIYKPATNRVVESRNVIFLETPAAGPQLGLEDDSFSGSLFDYGDEDDL